ncbi:MAG: glutamate--cysteine ligase [Mycobacterium sp.]|nr:glutamate--cysteine ligase [Mycobacterium sp.]
MGQQVRRIAYSREQRRQYRRKEQACLDALQALLLRHDFDSESSLTGMEIECHLVDTAYQPVMANDEVLAAIADPGYQKELGAHTIEFNVPPRPLAGRNAVELEAAIRASLNAASSKANALGAALVTVGILPTLMPEHLTGGWMSESKRYRALNDAVLAARGADVHVDISDVDRLRAAYPSIAPQSACTSVQLHVQASPADFAATWNAAQLLAAPQAVLGANSPYLLGHQLWPETRVELSVQALDSRPKGLSGKKIPPRVWFGERWITSVSDLFEENTRYFPALLPEVSGEEPLVELAAGRAPRLWELRLHNGTVYRWNRPVYDVVGGRPQLRLENRVLSSGPTVLDMVANALFFYGALRTISEQDRPLWSEMAFEAAEANYVSAARHGMCAALRWPGVGEVRANALVLDQLLPMADEGLRRWGVSVDVRDRFLGVIEGRAKTGRNGAAWQVCTVRALQDRGMSRRAALAEMLRWCCCYMHTNEPVHTWDTAQ